MLISCDKWDVSKLLLKMHSQSLDSVAKRVGGCQSDAWYVLQEGRDGSLRLFEVLIVVVWRLLLSDLAGHLLLLLDCLALHKVVDYLGVGEVWVLLVVSHLRVGWRTVAALILGPRTLDVWIWLEVFNGRDLLLGVWDVKVTRILNLNKNYLVFQTLPSHYQRRLPRCPSTLLPGPTSIYRHHYIYTFVNGVICF